MPHSGANILTNFPHLNIRLELPAFFYLPGIILLAAEQNKVH